ncbi:MAG: hypothetical protein WCO56_05700 [Verrucomicrobiota bacterium]
MRHTLIYLRHLALTLAVTAQLTDPVAISRAQEEPDSMTMESSGAGKVRLDGKTAAERGAALVRYVATCKPKPSDETYPKAAAPAYAARLMLNVDTRYALQKLDAAATVQLEKGKRKVPGNPLSPPGLDPFDKVALVNTYFLCKDKIPKATALKIRDYCALYAHKVWRGYGAWNYRLMMDGAGFLAAEEWPELVDTEGLNAEAIKVATRERLFSYFDEISRKNYSEYGCPIYLAVNLSATRMLAEFAKDAEMRKRAEFALDAMMVDIACSWNQGYNVGTAARAKYWGSTDTSLEAMGSTAAAAWVFFGAPRSISAEGIGWIHSFWMATPGSYHVPEIIVQIANDRAQPFVHRGYIAGMAKQDVHRMTYHSLNYSLCSQWDHPSGPTDGLYKEARRNMLKWVSPKGSCTFAVCMENPYRPYNLKENKANALGYGENPFSQYLQSEATLIGVDAVPENYPYYKLYAPFPTNGSIVKRIEKAGWVFCHNGSMLMGFHPVKPYTWGKKPWSGNDLLWCDARKNGWVLETSELKPFAGEGIDAELNRFAEAVLAKTKVDATGMEAANPTLRYQSLAGRLLELTWLPHKTPYAGQSKVDGKAVDYKSWPIHDNPWVRQELNRPILQLKHGTQRLTYDFARWTKDDAP